MNIADHSTATHFSISPNPTYSDAIVSFCLLECGDITLEICDLLGNIFYSISNFYDIGEHSVALETKNIPSSNYICRMLFKRFGTTSIKQIRTENFVVGK
jgi:hypothetical protein